jgi:hypothetical protein
MNHSICSADRATHAKIVATALFLATIVAGLSLFLHSSSKTPLTEKVMVLKARAPMAASTTHVILR